MVPLGTAGGAGQQDQRSAHRTRWQVQGNEEGVADAWTEWKPQPGWQRAV